MVEVIPIGRRAPLGKVYYWVEAAAPHPAVNLVDIADATCVI